MFGVMMCPRDQESGTVSRKTGIQDNPGSISAFQRWSRAMVVLAFAALLHMGAASAPAAPSASPTAGETEAPVTQDARRDLPGIREAMRVLVAVDGNKLPFTPGGDGPCALPVDIPVQCIGTEGRARYAASPRLERQSASHSHRPRAPPLTV